MPLSLMLAAAVLQPQAADLTRREIGETRLSLELPGGLITADTQPPADDPGAVAYESHTAINVESGLTVVIIYRKVKDDLTPMPADMVTSHSERLRQQHAEVQASSRRKKVASYDAAEISATFSEQNQKRGQLTLYVWGFTESWLVMVNYDPAKSAAQARRIIDSVQISSADWKRYRFTAANLLVELPTDPVSQAANVSSDHMKTLQTALSWRSTVNGIMDASVTYLRAKSGKPVGVDETFKAILESIRLAGEMGEAKTEELSSGGAVGKMLMGSYKIGDAESLFCVVILTRGTEGWDIRITAPSTIEAAQAARRVVDSVAIEAQSLSTASGSGSGGASGQGAAGGGVRRLGGSGAGFLHEIQIEGEAPYRSQ